jgi:hypothetical protein
VKKFLKRLLFLLLLLAAGAQLYYLFRHQKVTSGPIPIEEAQLVIQASGDILKEIQASGDILKDIEQWIAGKQFTQAILACKTILENKEEKPASRAEAVLQLKTLKSKGLPIPELPELAQEIPIQALEGSSHFFQKLHTEKIRAIGQAPYISAKTPAQTRLNAERAAKLDAYRQLLENIQGIAINSRIQLSEFLVQEGTSARIQGVIRGAVIIATRHRVEEGIVEVEIEVPGANLISSLEGNR